jgi:LPXTG-motif cell wall-anchored protein
MGRSRGSSVAFAAAYVALVVGLFLALGGAAYAQSSPTSAGDQYGPKVAGVQVSATTTTETAAESLPNTGLSLLGVVAVGGVLVATGVVLRRRERRKS